MLVIPNSFSSTETLPEYLIDEAIAEEDLFFQPTVGEMIKITSWVRYPDYDWLFGHPTADSPRAEKEAAFYIFRSRRKNTQHGFYLDEQELNDIINGLVKVQSEFKSGDKSFIGVDV